MILPLALTILFCFFGLITMVSVYTRWPLTVQSFLKAGTTALLLPLTLQMLRDRSPQTLMPLVLALSFATVADFLLHLELSLGVVFFALVQISFLVYEWGIGFHYTLYSVGSAAVILLLSLLFMGFSLPRIKRPRFEKTVIVVYFCLLTLAAMGALLTANPLAALGMVLFYVSDLVIGLRDFWGFKRGPFDPRIRFFVLNMTLYWAGLCCVAWSAGA